MSAMPDGEHAEPTEAGAGRGSGARRGVSARSRAISGDPLGPEVVQPGTQSTVHRRRYLLVAQAWLVAQVLPNA
jgi:hypothetical protein